LASLILVVNVVGELQRKRTLAASRGFLAAARLSCWARIYICSPKCLAWCPLLFRIRLMQISSFSRSTWAKTYVAPQKNVKFTPTLLLSQLLWEHQRET